MNIETKQKLSDETRNHRGFTLIELMITVAVVGILAGIAYPSYLDQVRKSTRTEATTAALECAGIQERRYTLRNDYDNAACDNLSDSLENYEIAVTHPSCQVNGNDTCFSIAVTPKTGSGQNDDSKCASFVLTDRGVRTSTNSGGTASQDCWQS